MNRDHQQPDSSEAAARVRFMYPDQPLPAGQVCRETGEHDYIEPDADDTVCRRCAVRRIRTP